jgi:hypothetical protein
MLYTDIPKMFFGIEIIKNMPIASNPLKLSMGSSSGRREVESNDRADQQQRSSKNETPARAVVICDHPYTQLAQGMEHRCPQ